MSNQMFQQLEAKIDQALEVIGLLKLQLEELEEQNTLLKTENVAIKNRQTQWEQSLATLLRKLENADFNTETNHRLERIPENEIA